MNKRIPCFFLLLGLLPAAWGQSLDSTTALAYVPPGAQTALALYDSATTESQHLYNGPQYYIYDSQAQEHQFYLSEEWINGSVVYDGQSFHDIPLLYDIVRDQLVARYRYGFGNVALQNQKVRSFTLDGHSFLRVEADTGRVEGLRTGYYDQLYNGPSRVVARRVKERLQQISETKIIVQFPEKDVFYIYKDGEYHPLPSKRALFSLLEEHKKELRRYLREQQLDFREKRGAAIVAVARQYDQLRQSR